MRVAGGIIALIAGIFGTFAAGFTLFVGGLGGAFRVPDADLVVGLGWGGVAFSFITIILAAVALGTRSKAPGILLIPCAVTGAILGGTIVAVFMGLSLVGGILTLFGREQRVQPERRQPVSFDLPPLQAPPRARVSDNSGGTSGRFCKNCGAPLDSIQAFCGVCGVAIEGASLSPTASAPASEPPKLAATPDTDLFEATKERTSLSQTPSSNDTDFLARPSGISAAQRFQASRRSHQPAVGVWVGLALVVVLLAAATLWFNPSLLRGQSAPKSVSNIQESAPGLQSANSDRAPKPGQFQSPDAVSHPPIEPHALASVVAAENLGTEVKWFESKFSLVPKFVDDVLDIRKLQYEIAGCDVKVTTESNKSTIRSIGVYVAGGSSSCALKFNTHGFDFDSRGYDPAEFRAHANRLKAHFWAMLYPGNIEVAWWGAVTFRGARANSNVDTTFYFYDDYDGMSNWRDLIESDDEQTDAEQKLIDCSNKWDLEAARLWPLQNLVAIQFTITDATSPFGRQSMIVNYPEACQ